MVIQRRTNRAFKLSPDKKMDTLTYFHWVSICTNQSGNEFNV